MSDKKKKPARKPTKKETADFKAGQAKHNAGMVTVTMQAAMKQTGKSMGHIYRCINDGRLVAFKVGRATVFRQADIDTMMAPVPWTPPKERVTLASRAKKPAKARPKTKTHRASELKAKHVKRVAKAKKPARTPSVKRAVAKALSGMAVERQTEIAAAE